MKANITQPQLTWLTGPDAGQSSITILSVMVGQDLTRGGPSVPYDPDDFGRCHRLLERFPEFRKRMPEVVKKHPRWKGLVENWADLEALYMRDYKSGKSPELYQRIQELIR